MNKIWLIGIGAAAAGLFVLAYWFTSPPAPPTTNTPNTPNISTSNTSTVQPGLDTGSPASSNGGKIVVATSSAKEATLSEAILSIAGANNIFIQVTNFLKDPATFKDPINPGIYYLGYHVYEGVLDATATDNPPYIIEYISATQYFNIVLLQEPIGSVRAAAEQYLIAQLGITQAQMCQLNYTLGTPNRVNSQYAGTDLGFSFCPGATVLP